MKILYLSTDPKMSLSDTSGYAVHMTELIRAFREMGNEVLPIVTGHKNSAEGGSPHKRAIRGILPGGTIELARTIWDVFSDFKTYLRAQRALLAFHPNFIYERYAVFHQSGIILSKRCRIPIILELNAPIWERDLHYGHRPRTLARKIEKRVLMLGDAIVVVSDFLRDYLINLEIPASKIHVISNAADPNTFNPSIDGNLIKRKYGIENKVVVGFVGGFARRQGIYLLLTAAPEIIKNNRGIHFLFVGDGSGRDLYEKYVIENSLQKYVTFAGSVSYQSIPQYIAAMDITVLPNTANHCSPIKLFEYMAMAKAIVAPGLDTIEHIITHGQNGFLTTSGDAESLRNTILYLSQDRNLRSQVGSNARRTVLEHHTWKKNAERVIQIFLSLSKS
ncbi:MAG: glycosyltransferase family 4 protein [Candidatus Hodarchaeota archaeon]